MPHRGGHDHESPLGAPGGGGPAALDRRANRRRVRAALALAAVYMAAEVVGGWWTGSLALLADAGHMLSDVAALSVTLVAIRIAERPADARRTFGHTRAEILAALGQGAGLVLVALLVVLEAVERLGAPRAVEAGGMLVIATGGLLVNLAALAILEAGRGHSLNVRGAWLHVLSDALGSVGAIAAGLAIALAGWTWADPAASLLIAGLIVLSAWHLIREAVDVLMETAPAHLDVEEIRRALAAEPGVADVHDLHVWTIGSGEVSLSAHVVATEPAERAPAVLRRLHGVLARRFGIEHATVQIEDPAFAGLSDHAGSCATACDGAVPAPTPPPAAAPAGRS